MRTRATPPTPISGRCRRSAGTRSSGRSIRAAARSLPSSTPVWMDRTPTSPDSSLVGRRSSTAPPAPRTRTATAPPWPASSPPRRTTARASPASASTASGSCPITVLGADGQGQDSDIIAGVVWAVSHGADVINMSFSNPGYSAALQAAIDYAWAHDVVVVAATGNDGSSSATFPAGDRGVVGVSNTDQDDSAARVVQLRRGRVPGCSWDLDRHARCGRRDHDHHGNVGLVGHGRRGGGPAARGGSVRLERGHRGPAGPQCRCGRDGRRRPATAA